MYVRMTFGAKCSAMLSYPQKFLADGMLFVGVDVPEDGWNDERADHVDPLSRADHLQNKNNLLILGKAVFTRTAKPDRKFFPFVFFIQKRIQFCCSCKLGFIVQLIRIYSC
jgi:hypothetical protein